VEASPKDQRGFSPASYELAVADVAAHGGRWVISLDDQTAAKPADSTGWKRTLAAAAYFKGHSQWSTYTPAAVLGVVSDFTGPNEFMGQELLNLLARAGMHYRIVMKDNPDYSGMKAAMYADQQPPSAELRRRGMQFVEAGGLLITTPAWGTVSGRTGTEQFPRFAVKSVGKGRVATTLSVPDDPWQLANDSVVLISHRYDLVRCFNSGSFASFFTFSPDRKQALVHLLFYADRGPTEGSVRIAGKFRAAAISTVAQPQFKPVPAEFSGDWVEVHLPPVPPYVALELTV
jgi:hypothetical protein